MSDKVDLLGQYIGQVLIPRLNRADELFEKGKYFEAVNKQKSIIRALYREISKSEEKSNGEKILLNWIEKIDSLYEFSPKVKGETNEITQYNLKMHRNNLAQKIYENLDWEIWGKLHELGYFAGKRMYGPKVEDIDMEKAVEI